MMWLILGKNIGDATSSWFERTFPFSLSLSSWYLWREGTVATVSVTPAAAWREEASETQAQESSCSRLVVWIPSWNISHLNTILEKIHWKRQVEAELMNLGQLKTNILWWDLDIWSVENGVYLTSPLKSSCYTCGTAWFDTSSQRKDLGDARPFVPPPIKPRNLTLKLEHSQTQDWNKSSWVLHYN